MRPRNRTPPGRVIGNVAIMGEVVDEVDLFLFASRDRFRQPRGGGATGIGRLWVRNCVMLRMGASMLSCAATRWSAGRDEPLADALVRPVLRATMARAPRVDAPGGPVLVRVGAVCAEGHRDLVPIGAVPPKEGTGPLSPPWC